MLLAIDVGNTNITLGLFKYEDGRPVKGPALTWRLATDKYSTADEYGIRILDLFHYALIDISDVKAVAVASVVPGINATLAEAAKKYFHVRPFFFSQGEPVVNVLYANPAEVGDDRIANAVAAHEFFRGPAIVLDFGTATTFDCINAGGDYVGGVITPGPAVAAESLSLHTARLPKVAMIKPQRAIGKSTVEGIQSGLFFGYVGLIKEILKQVKKEMRGNPKVIATGGLAGLIVPEIKEVKAVVPELTLEGIRLVYLKSK